MQEPLSRSHEVSGGQSDMSMQNMAMLEMGAQSDGVNPAADSSSHKSPWFHNNGNFKSNVIILKSDLILHKPNTNFIDGFLCLNDTNYISPWSSGGAFVYLVFLQGNFLEKKWWRSSYHAGPGQLMYHIILIDGWYFDLKKRKTWR